MIHSLHDTGFTVDEAAPFVASGINASTAITGWDFSKFLPTTSSGTSFAPFASDYFYLGATLQQEGDGRSWRPLCTGGALRFIDHKALETIPIHVIMKSL